MSKSNKSRLVPGIGRIPFPAYRGDEPYIFVSYAHKDAKRVFAEIKRFYDANYHVWYDEGIAPGNEWADEIERALSNCALFVVFLTKASVDSENVADEINLAIDEKKPAIAVYLEECELKGGLKLRFKRKQAIMKYEMTEEEYVYKYTTTFDDLLGREGQPPALPVPVPFGEKVKRFFAAHKKAVVAVLVAVVLAGAGFGIFALASNGAKETAANSSVSATVTESSASTQQSSSAESAVNDGSPVARTTGEEGWDDLLSAEPTPLSSFETDQKDFMFLTKFIGNEKDVVIPGYFDFIAHYSFSQTDIKSVVIPDSDYKIIAVQARAFQDCKTLERAYMGDGVSFGMEAFKGCTSLREVRLPSDSKVRTRKEGTTTYTTEGLKSIITGLFLDCSSLESVVIPDTVTEIDENAFKNCTSLKTIAIPSSVKEILTEAFANCTSLTEVKLNEGLEKIDDAVFTACPIKELEIPSTVNEIGGLSYLSGTKFKVHKGSYAETFIKENNLNYEVVE